MFYIILLYLETVNRRIFRFMHKKSKNGQNKFIKKGGHKNEKQY